MKIAEILCVVVILLAPAAYAADKKLPGMDEGPAGCGWRAAVIDTHPGEDFVIDLVLTQKIGKCMFNPGPCGTKQDHVSAHVKKDDIQSYHPGAIVKVWITKDVVSFDTPQCTRTPG